MSPKPNQDRRDAIIRSAERLFADRRFDEVLMEDVAQAAAVGKGTLYRYFDDKESLYFAVVFEGLDQLRAQLQQAGDDGHPVRQLKTAIHAIVSFLSRNRFFFQLMNQEDARLGDAERGHRKRWNQERGALVDSLTGILQAGQDADSFDLHHPRADAQILLGMVRSTLRFNDERLGVEEIVDEILRIYLHGVMTPAFQVAETQPAEWTR